jgi:hypothetical protein
MINVTQHRRMRLSFDEQALHSSSSTPVQGVSLLFFFPIVKRVFLLSSPRNLHLHLTYPLTLAAHISSLIIFQIIQHYRYIYLDVQADTYGWLASLNGIARVMCSARGCLGRPLLLCGDGHSRCKPLITFRGEGQTNALNHGMEYYDPRVEVQWQKRVWTDIPIMRRWIERQFKQATEPEDRTVSFRQFFVL